MRIESIARTRLVGYRSVHVVSVGEKEADLTERMHFVCVNARQPLIFTYAEDARKQAEAIIATLTWAR